jgi:hypothetical protein
MNKKLFENMLHKIFDIYYEKYAGENSLRAMMKYVNKNNPGFSHRS